MQKKVDSSQLEKKKYVKVEINHRFINIYGPSPVLHEESPFGPQGIDKIKNFELCSKDKCEGEPDNTVSIDLYFGRRSNMLWAFASVFTLTLIPMKEQEVFEVKAIILDKKGEVLKKYRLSDHIDTWFQLFFLFGMPFQNSKIKDEVAQNMINEVLRLAINDKIL